MKEKLEHIKFDVKNKRFISEGKGELLRKVKPQIFEEGLIRIDNFRDSLVKINNRVNNQLKGLSHKNTRELALFLAFLNVETSTDISLVFNDGRNGKNISKELYPYSTITFSSVDELVLVLLNPYLNKRVRNVLFLQPGNLESPNPDLSFMVLKRNEFLNRFYRMGFRVEGPILFLDKRKVPFFSGVLAKGEIFIVDEKELYPLNNKDLNLYFKETRKSFLLLQQLRRFKVRKLSCAECFSSHSLLSTTFFGYPDKELLREFLKQDFSIGIVEFHYPCNFIRTSLDFHEMFFKIRDSSVMKAILSQLSSFLRGGLIALHNSYFDSTSLKTDNPLFLRTFRDNPVEYQPLLRALLNKGLLKVGKLKNFNGGKEAIFFEEAEEVLKTTIKCLTREEMELAVMERIAFKTALILKELLNELLEEGHLYLKERELFILVRGCEKE